VESLLSIQDVARLLGVSRASIYRLIDNQGLPAIRLSDRVQRFRERDVADWVEGRASLDSGGGA
jgi:excisionase family DNA binding protein